MYRLVLAATFSLTMILAPNSASAGMFGEKTMRQPLPTQAVERSLILPRGWVEVQLDFEQKTSTSSWNSDGSRDQWQHSRWSYRTQRATFTLGFAKRANLWFDFPVHQARLTQDREGVAADQQTDIRDASIGDPRAGWIIELFNQESPTASVAFEGWYKGAAANEAPGTYIGGPLNVNGFVFTTGTPDVYLGFGAKKQLGPLGLEAHAGYKHRFSATVQYLIELENSQFAGRMKPGHQFLVDTKVQLQLGPVAPYVGSRGLTRGEAAVGTTSGGPGVIRPDKQLRKLSGSGGSQLDLVAGLQLNASRGFDVTLGANLPLIGEDFMFFPIEDLHPTAGTTLFGSVEIRY